MAGRKANKRSVRKEHARARKSSSGQAAIEYLTTYGWAVIIVAVVIAVLYLFVLAPSSVAPQKCTLNSGAYCTDIVFGSNATASKAVMILSNSQQYPISNPSMIINVQNKGNITAKCTPGYVLPGGSILCIANISSSFGQGSYVAGNLYLKSTTCVTGTNQSTCSGSTQQTYTGIINAHTQPLLTANTLTITLAAVNATQTADGGLDHLVSTVKLLGYPYQGASVAFSSNRSFTTISPPSATSDSNGNAGSYVSSNLTGNALITATFAGISANVTVQFAPPVYITLDSNVTACPTCIVAVLDGKAYTQTQVNIPLTIPVAYGSRQVYSYIGIVTNLAGNTRDVIVSTSGCGGNGQNNTFIATFNCTVNATYQLQYLLTQYASDPDGSVSPGTSWIDSKHNVSISTSMYTAPSLTRYIWEGWSGTGTGSATDGPTGSTNLQITMYGPITEIAQYLTQYYLTMSSYPGSGGSTTVIGSENSSSPGSGWYDRASSATLEASPYGGYTFGYWTGASGGSTTSITMSAPMSVTANFYVCITVNDNGGGYETGTGCYQYGSSAYITANPDSGYAFGYWTGASGGQDTYVSVYTPTTITATYDPCITVTDYGGGSETGSGCYSYGSSAYITANPDPDYTFAGWNNGGGQDQYVGVYSPATYIASYDYTPPPTTVNGSNATTIPQSSVPGDVCVSFDRPELNNWQSDGQLPSSAFSGYGSTGTGIDCWPSGTNINLVQPTNENNQKYQFEYWLVGGSEISGSSFTLYSDTDAQAIYYPFVDVFPCGNNGVFTNNQGDSIKCASPGSATDGSGEGLQAFSQGSNINLVASGGSICNPSSPGSGPCFVGYAALDDVGNTYTPTCAFTSTSAFNLNYYTQVRAYWCTPGVDDCDSAISNCWNNR